MRLSRSMTRRGECCRQLESLNNKFMAEYTRGTLAFEQARKLVEREQQLVADGRAALRDRSDTPGRQPGTAPFRTGARRTATSPGTATARRRTITSHASSKPSSAPRRRHRISIKSSTIGADSCLFRPGPRPAGNGRNCWNKPGAMPWRRKCYRPPWGLTIWPA